MRADLVLRGATVHTLDRRTPRAAEVAIAGGRIVALHDMSELIGLSTRVIDFGPGGGAIVPGFVDSHIHFGHWTMAHQQVDLDAASSIEEGLAVVERFAAGPRVPEWIQGRGWDRNRWGRLPTRWELDAIFGARPVALSSHDGHSLWLSSAALNVAGIERDTSDPTGGVIERDDAGVPTGVLFENAQDLVRPHIPEPSDAELRRALEHGLRLAAATGLTGIHNFEDARTRRAFRAIEAAGELTLRVYHGVPRGELREARERGLSTGVGSELLRVGPVKLFADGALGSRTAFLLSPYEGRAGDDYRGVATLSAEELEHDICSAADAGLDIAVHAIGDAAVRRVLDVYERARQAYSPLAQRMLRIEHAQLVHPDDVPRFARLGVIASMQPIHATSDWRTAERHWSERSRHAYAWRDLIQAGATVAFGTDAPVESIAPLGSLTAAVTRCDPTGAPEGGWYPEQCLSLDEALRAYTLGSARAERAAGRRGTLAPGMDADLVVLQPDPFLQSRSEVPLSATRVALTIVGGRITFEGDAQRGS